MRKFTIAGTLIFLLFCTHSFAQSPEKISYQAIIRDANNSLIKNQQIGMQISILQVDDDSTAVYTETQTPMTNSNGLFTIEIGTGITSDDFSEIDWANGPYFIKTETDPSGGTSYSITGVCQLLSVPYALYSKEAESIHGIDEIVSQSVLEDTAASLRSAISKQPTISYYPKSSMLDNNVLVSFSGNSTTTFSQASPVAIRFEQATAIYPVDIRYINEKNVDVKFYIPYDAATGTYDVIINPNEDEPTIIEKAFFIQMF